MTQSSTEKKLKAFLKATLLLTIIFMPVLFVLSVAGLKSAFLAFGVILVIIFMLFYPFPEGGSDV